VRKPAFALVRVVPPAGFEPAIVRAATVHYFRRVLPDARAEADLAQAACPLRFGDFREAAISRVPSSVPPALCRGPTASSFQAFSRDSQWSARYPLEK
jgi:hypothetical protein